MHQLVRTVAFLAPERARGSGASAAADIYSLAAVMCLSAGAPMPSGLSTLGVVNALANQTWAPQVPAVYHEPYRGLLTRMLSNDETQRPSAREVADLLGRPAAAIPTIPEMPAIVLPKGFVMPRSQIVDTPADVETHADAADAADAAAPHVEDEATRERSADHPRREERSAGR